MEDRVYTTNRTASAVAWAALIVGIVALILAWMAYNRAGADLEQQIQTQVEKSLNATQDATQDASDAVDAGPDGVDEDDTDVNTQP
ncbi:MAG: hypothetical protein V4611_00320 [Patescibacteria group bacterium]